MSKWVVITRGDDGTPWPDWAFRFMCPACKLKTSTESNFALTAERICAMNQKDIDRQLRALDEAKITIEALWAKLKSRDDLVNQLETENYRLRRKAGGE